ncbi:uncharacterized protein [Miscanthus floridulus]|uniref:uncharacterized protein n=1 Tax=Miscanthus floridulus TaxID=154761 RepID=UPI00345AA4FC
MAPYRSPRRHTRHPHFEQPLLTGSNSQTLVGPPQTLEIQHEGHLHHPFPVNLEDMSLSVTKEHIVRETASAGEVDCRRCRVATATAPDRRRVTRKQIAREAAREEADYCQCQVAAATDRRRWLGVADRCRRQVAMG